MWTIILIGACIFISFILIIRNVSLRKRLSMSNGSINYTIYKMKLIIDFLNGVVNQWDQYQFYSEFSNLPKSGLITHMSQREVDAILHTAMEKISRREDCKAAFLIRQDRYNEYIASISINGQIEYTGLALAGPESALVNVIYIYLDKNGL